MSKTSESSLISILNLLTPGLVEEYSNYSAEKVVYKQAAGGETFNEESFSSKSTEARILPFRDLETHSDRRFRSEDQAPESDSEKEEDQESSSDFLLNERLKSRESKRKLLEGEARKLYKAGADLEFFEAPQDGKQNSEGQAVEPKGILVNKKHP